METKTPIKTALFQISNKADEDTRDSTNIAVLLYEIGSYTASDAYTATHFQAAYGTRSQVEEWEAFTDHAKQDNIEYAVRTAFRDVADVHVAVRLGWPHLPKNPANYDSEMEQTFRSLLNSVTGDLGTYQRRVGEAAQRPK
jgi:hypothetical protein